MTTLLQSGSDITECNYVCFTDTPDLKENTFHPQIASYTTKEALSLLLDGQKFKYTVWNKLYCKKSINLLQFEVGKLHEDVFFTYQAFCLCERVAKTDDPLYYYR